MNTRQLSSHYEINKHCLNQDLKNAITLIVDNISILSDEQVKQLRVAMDEDVLRRSGSECNSKDNYDYQNQIH